MDVSYHDALNGHQAVFEPEILCMGSWRTGVPVRGMGFKALSTNTLNGEKRGFSGWHLRY